MFWHAKEIFTDKKFTVFKRNISEERINNVTNFHRFLRLIFISVKTDIIRIQNTAHFSSLIGGSNLFCQVSFPSSPFTIFFFLHSSVINVGDPHFPTMCLIATEDISEGQGVRDISLAHRPPILIDVYQLRISEHSIFKLLSLLQDLGWETWREETAWMNAV